LNVGDASHPHFLSLLIRGCDLLVDFGVYAGNTAELMLVGKEFNRDVKGFTLVVEAHLQLNNQICLLE
jgi:hypothetical protein